MKKTVHERFWEKVDKNGPVAHPDLGPCWMWPATHKKKGYGRFKLDGRTVSAHRASWIINNGSIPDGLFICHRCDNPGCVRPDHLFTGTRSDNTRDMYAKNRGVYDLSKAKLTVEKVRNIRSQFDGTSSYYARTASKYGVCPGTIRNIIKGTTWRLLDAWPVRP